MIHISFEGGLGNQMFQYSFARYLQDKFQDEVAIDISKYEYEKIEFRDYELFNFNISKDWVVDKTQKSRLRRFGVGYIFYLIITWIYLKINRNRIEIKFISLYQRVINFFGFYRTHFGEKIEPRDSFTKEKFVRGMWFRPDIVQKMDKSIRNELKVITPITPENQRVLDKIKDTNSVAMHIRRGDYVDLGLVICDISYYKRCMDKMADLVEQPMFFIFSDDISWVKENLKTDYNMFFVDNKNSAPEDMRLMYNCKHFIMSNSTFSWWGAYLGSATDKKVIVPEVWSKNGKRSKLILDNWIVERTI